MLWGLGRACYPKCDSVIEDPRHPAGRKRRSQWNAATTTRTHMPRDPGFCCMHILREAIRRM